MTGEDERVNSKPLRCRCFHEERASTDRHKGSENGQVLSKIQDMGKIEEKAGTLNGGHLVEGPNCQC